MITAIKNSNFTNLLCSTNLGISNQNNTNKVNSNYMTDSVSFSGNVAKLSNASTELVQKFAKGLKLNKLYKIDTPVEKVRIASVAAPQSP